MPTRPAKRSPPSWGTASSSAPTPVYHLYQDSLGLSHLTLTVIFAAYAFSLLAGVLTIGAA